jgi:hypothetical protein
MPDVDAIRRSRLKKKTLFEMPDEEDIVQCRAEYVRLAETLWRDRAAGTRAAARPRNLRASGVRLMRGGRSDIAKPRRKARTPRGVRR